MKKFSLFLFGLFFSVSLFAQATGNVAKIIRNGLDYASYTTLNAAAEATQDGDTLRLLADVSERVTFTGNSTPLKRVVFDFRGHTITYLPTTGGKGNIYMSVEKHVDLILMGGSFVYDLHTADNTSSASIFYVYEGAKITIVSGTFKYSDRAESHANDKLSVFYVAGNSIVNIEGGTFASCGSSEFRLDGTNTINIYGGLFKHSPEDRYLPAGFASYTDDETGFYGVKMQGTTNAYGYGTYCSAKPFRIAANQNVTAYTAKVIGNQVELNEITNVPAGVGVFLSGATYATVEMEQIKAGEADVIADGENNLLPVISAGMNNFGYWSYGLSGDKFHRITAGTTLKKGKAYFDLGYDPNAETGPNAPLHIVFNPNRPITTGVETETAVKATKAMLNGKMVIIKGNTIYNVMGGAL